MNQQEDQYKKMMIESYQNSRDFLFKNHFFIDLSDTLKKYQLNPFKYQFVQNISRLVMNSARQNSTVLNFSGSKVTINYLDRQFFVFSYILLYSLFGPGNSKIIRFSKSLFLSTLLFLREVYE